MTDRFELVPFHEHQIMTMKTADAVNVIMKPIVESLGLTWHGQFERMNRHPVIREGIRVTRIPSAGGMQEMVALELEHFHGWLVTLSPDRVRDEAKRELIIRYQREAFRVIFEHFHGKMNARPLTVRGANGLVSMHNHYLALIKKMQRAVDPAERSSVYSLLCDVGDRINHTPPPMDQLGREAPQAPEILQKFWHTYELLMERGYRLNLSRKPELIAINLGQMQEAILAEKLDFLINPDVHAVLESSTSPQFVAQKAVNPKPSDPPDPKAKKSVYCWVFQRTR